MAGHELIREWSAAATGHAIKGKRLRKHIFQGLRWIARSKPKSITSTVRFSKHVKKSGNVRRPLTYNAIGGTRDVVSVDVLRDEVLVGMLIIWSDDLPKLLPKKLRPQR